MINGPIQYPERPIHSVAAAMEWIQAEWAERLDGEWYVARTDCHVPATARQAKLLDEAEKILLSKRGQQHL